MRTLICTALWALSGVIWAGAAQADTTTAIVKVYSLDVKERIQNLELIDITAEKPANDQAGALEPELEAILDEVAALEVEE